MEDKYKDYHEPIDADGNLIEVGDEIAYVNNTNKKFVVTKADKITNYLVANAYCLSGFSKEGNMFVDKIGINWRKTGRHFNLVKQLLDQMNKKE